MGAPPGFIPLKKGVLDYCSRTLIMAILNVTPDSFSDGGKFYDPVCAIQHGVKLARDGADIIDVGGESTRPGSESISVPEELKRVMPVVEALAREVDIPISIDTYHAEVASRALDAGASIVNDTSAMRFDPRMLGVVAERGVPVILMHMKGRPKDMQVDPSYDDLLTEIHAFFEERIGTAEKGGVAPEKIVIDPGIGFGKTVTHNLLILKHLSSFESLGKPILVGTSRKSFIGNILQAEVEQREEGTAATVAVGICNGAHMVRVHDVSKIAPVVRMTDAILNASW
jgi:dihydropteroate synthase